MSARKPEDVFREGLRTIVQALIPVARRFCDAMATLGPAIRRAMNVEINVAGLEARFYVRAGLDPAYADVTSVDQLVREILDGRAEDTLWLNPENRRLVAIAAMRGWVMHR